MAAQPPSDKPDDSLDSFLANQQSQAAPDDPALQQFHQYAQANPPTRNYAAGIGIGVLLLLLAIRFIAKLMQQGNF